MSEHPKPRHQPTPSHLTASPHNTAPYQISTKLRLCCGSGRMQPPPGKTRQSPGRPAVSWSPGPQELSVTKSLQAQTPGQSVPRKLLEQSPQKTLIHTHTNTHIRIIILELPTKCIPPPPPLTPSSI